MISQELHENWTFRRKGDEEWLPARVPGCVHTDLLENKLIPDPFIGINAKSVQWIEKEEWEYHCLFNISSYILDHDQLEIWFYGVDTYSEIFLNGKSLLVTNNMFHPWSISVKSLLHEGENSLDIIFASAFTRGLEQYEKLPYHLPSSNDKDTFRVSPFTRKSSYHFGWDWAPRMLTSGLWKNIELLAFNKLKIRDFCILQLEQNKNYASLQCDLELEVHSGGEYIFAIYVDKDLISTGKYRLNEGINKFSLPFGIHNPKLWYPRGYGSPELYKITIDVKYEDKVIDTRQTTTGIRKIELINGNQDIKEGFHFRVNGIDIFAKGANIIPMDFFLPRIKKANYKSLIDNAVSVNMNMLRVWGGAAFEHDSFYNLCNKEGIMVWQDFMFACMMYPSDKSFLASVREEIDYNVKRLRNHPSVVLWCGNNEVLEGYHLWGWKEDLGENAEIAFDSYKKIFHEIIPDMLRTLDPSRPYVASSPMSADKTGASLPGLQSGDYHYWDIIKKPLPLSAYAENVGRFMSEFGFKSYPELKTLSSYAEEKDFNIRSEVLEFHQGWETGADLVERNLHNLYGKPGSFEDFLYLSQLTQKEAIKIAIEAHRRAKPWCMGTLFWQFNDCWPCASWSAVDYYGRWKALMYELKHLFADTIISPVIKNNQLRVFVVSDKSYPNNLLATIKLLTFSGQELYSKEVDFHANSAEADMVFSVSTDKLNIKNIEDQVVLVTELYDENKRLDRNLLYFLKPSELTLKPATPKIEISINQNITTIFLESDVLIKNMVLENHDQEGFFTDNYFDLLPGEKKIVLFHSASAQTSEWDLTVRSLNGIFF
jgi:beta-mannosidase